ncbi:MAG: hypothetical protein MZV65_32370 [Chromatiales bacterium]|nr:hypothetical protein [Chromatiales bacterium]
MAQRNAEHALTAQLSSQAGMRHRLEALREALGLEFEPSRLECFDISHTRGEATVAACVVFGAEGPIKSDYRRYNVEGITPGDDYAAHASGAPSALHPPAAGRRGRLPDILFVDGGKGQLAQRRATYWRSCGLPGSRSIGIAKGPERKPGLETLYLFEAKPPHYTARRFGWPCI